MAARTLVAFCTLLSLVSYVSAEDRYQERRERERHFINGRVVQVVDGDTCVVEDRTGHRHNVNLYGVDAAENGQAYCTHARGNIYVGDHHINVDQVREGYGWHHTDHERVPEFAEAERDARDHHRGLWA